MVPTVTERPDSESITPPERPRVESRLPLVHQERHGLRYVIVGGIHTLPRSSGSTASAPGSRADRSISTRSETSENAVKRACYSFTTSPSAGNPPSIQVARAPHRPTGARQKHSQALYRCAPCAEKLGPLPHSIEGVQIFLRLVRIIFCGASFTFQIRRARCPADRQGAEPQPRFRPFNPQRVSDLASLKLVLQGPGRGHRAAREPRHALSPNLAATRRCGKLSGPTRPLETARGALQLFLGDFQTGQVQVFLSGERCPGGLLAAGPAIQAVENPT